MNIADFPRGLAKDAGNPVVRKPVQGLRGSHHMLLLLVVETGGPCQLGCSSQGEVEKVGRPRSGLAIQFAVLQ